MDNIPDRVKFPSELQQEEEAATPLIIEPTKQQEVEALNEEDEEHKEFLNSLGGFSGVYAIPQVPQQQFTVIDQEDALLFVNPRQDTFRFVQESDTSFYIDANSAEGIAFRPAGDIFDLVLINSKGGKTIAKRID